jgi:hypothetical protein
MECSETALLLQQAVASVCVDGWHLDRVNALDLQSA